MNKIFEKLDRLMDGMSKEEQKLFNDNRYPYILTKADLYLRIGPEKYRSSDFFGMPDAEWTDDELRVISDGCMQVLDGKGMTPEKPFTNLGVEGFRQLFELFHFENSGRETTRPAPGKFLDKTEMRHMVDEAKVTYYNLVEYDFGRKGDTK